jgi:DNA-binding transcriptional LysR family regulator
VDQFKAVAAFVHAARLGSFGKAAIELGITQQQVSKSIRQLEEHVKVRLFNRTTRRVALTDDGKRFFKDADAGLSRLQQAFTGARAGSDEPSGDVRITAPHAVAKTLLVPLLVAFRQLHPRIVVELLVDDHMTDMVAERIDLGFRAGTIQDGRLIARKLFPIQHLVCAAPAFLETHGAPQSIEDLARFSCTGFRHVNSGKVMPWEFMRGAQLIYRDLPAAFLTNDVETEIEAVLQGLGIGQLASFTAVPHINAGRLIPLLLEAMTERYALYLYYPSREHMPSRIRLLLDFLTKKLKSNEQFYLSASAITAHKRVAKPGGRQR